MATWGATPDRRRSFEAEEARLRASLELLRVTLANLETEADLLRAAVEGAQAARRKVGGTR